MVRRLAERGAWRIVHGMRARFATPLAPSVSGRAAGVVSTYSRGAWISRHDPPLRRPRTARRQHHPLTHPQRCRSPALKQTPPRSPQHDSPAMRVVAGTYGGRKLIAPRRQRDPPHERPRPRSALQRPRHVGPRRPRPRPLRRLRRARHRSALPRRPIRGLRRPLAQGDRSRQGQPRSARHRGRHQAGRGPRRAPRGIQPIRGIRSRLPRSPVSACRRAGAGAVGRAGRGARTRRPCRHRERPSRSAAARPTPGRRAPLRRHRHPHP